MKDGSGKESLFLLDALYTQVSVFGEVENHGEKIAEIIKRMEKIQDQHGVKSNYIPQARLVYQ